tara:strand:+ start:6618 stop:7904 length:1287 start_codon:yes stop_codon:yes gene_type:complete
MNVLESSFLVIGEGVTYKHCSSFFKKNRIAYHSTTTDNIIDISDTEIICKNQNINFKKIDYVVVSPGISPSNKAINDLKKLGCRITTDIEIVQNLTSSKFICITGTNGKTSTVNLIADIMNDNNIKTIACGNNGVSVFRSLHDEYDYVVLELSSYQLEYIKTLNSYISVILNISPDHLDRHINLKNYLDIKLKIFNNSKYKIISKNLSLSNEYSTFEVKDNRFYLNDIKLNDLSIIDDSHLSYQSNTYPIFGIHESHNLCASISVLKIIGLSLKDILKSFSKRKLLKHRVEEFLSFNGIKFINDSKSTNADSTHNALMSVRGNIILIMGGDNKKMSYDKLKSSISKRVKILILIGENRELLDEELSVDSKKVFCDSLEHATSYIFSVMTPGDTVLMSPGTSSYCMYDNYQQRGNHFKELIKKYVSQQN